MKPTITTILILLLSFCACLYFPWWTIAIVAFIVSALIPQRPWVSFLSGFIALFLLWGGLSVWISSNNDHILAHRVSKLILPVDSPVLLILLTAVIGGLIAGLGSLTGSFLHTGTPAANKQL